MNLILANLVLTQQENEAYRCCIHAGRVGGCCPSPEAAETAIGRHRRRRHPEKHQTHQQTHQLRPQGRQMRHGWQEHENHAAPCPQRKVLRLLPGTGHQLEQNHRLDEAEPCC